MGWICPRCGTENLYRDRVCPACAKGVGFLYRLRQRMAEVRGRRMPETAKNARMDKIVTQGLEPVKKLIHAVRFMRSMLIYVLCLVLLLGLRAPYVSEEDMLKLNSYGMLGEGLASNLMQMKQRFDGMEQKLTYFAQKYAIFREDMIPAIQRSAAEMGQKVAERINSGIDALRLLAETLHLKFQNVEISSCFEFIWKERHESG